MTETTPDFRVFLSHRYDAVAVNCFAYDVLSEKATLSFDVDPGRHPETKQRLSTNVTLLETAMRRAEAFVGIFVFDDGKPGPGPNNAMAARRDSGYSLLELDIAERMRRPGLVFCDSRIQSHFRFPAHYRVESLDVAAIRGAVGRTQARRLRNSVDAFLKELVTWTSPVRSTDRYQERAVALLLPGRKRDGLPLTAAQIKAVEKLLKDYSWNPERVSWETIDYRLLRDLDRFEWVLVDVSSPAFESLASYVHGRGIPLMKMHRADRTPTGLLDMLAGYESIGGSGVRGIGYRRDVLAWTDTRSLKAGLNPRLDRLHWGMRLIEAERAEDYFLDAARRPTPVFISYSGDDEEEVRPLAHEIRRRFANVFDYRDGKSLISGKPWGPQLEQRLGQAELSVIFLTPSYLEKPPCVREAELMSNHRFEGTLHIIVIKLANAADGTTIKLPGLLSADQYLRIWEHSDAEQTIDRLMEHFDRLTADG